MTVETLNQLLDQKLFQSTDDGVLYRFIGGSTLQVNGVKKNSAHYQLQLIDGDVILTHGSLLGTEPIVIEVVKRDPVTLALEKQYSKEFVGTWKEIKSI